ncbi:MAG: carbamate kinase [Candidatus Zixiibacteriota bacterium]|nr:MAG: carbamate kinase [candidate division Zixibacteria bacterium]
MSLKKTAVVALGGNAITRAGEEDTIYRQFANTRKSLDGIVELIREGYNLVITHGNGPQVGNALLRCELARDKAPYLPLGVLVADTEGGMGYMIEQSLQNRLRAEGINRPVVTIITQMLCDEKDPATHNPTKFIGQFYNEQQAKEYSETRGWQMRTDADRGWRRVVPSPVPYRAVESETIKTLVEAGTIVIAAGGGGIPIYIDEKGNYEGIDAVIDKDLGSAVVASEIGAEILSILTPVSNVFINFGKPDQKALERVTLSEVKAHYGQGQFPAGSMGPKIRAAIRFLEGGGKLVTITSLENALTAICGKAGTRIVPD